jgi:hypothetical protein
MNNETRERNDDEIIAEFLKEFGGILDAHGMFGTKASMVEHIRNIMDEKDYHAYSRGYKQGRAEGEQSMFEKIKNDIAVLQYDTSSTTFKEIILSRLSSRAWFDILTPPKVDK